MMADLILIISQRKIPNLHINSEQEAKRLVVEKVPISTKSQMLGQGPNMTKYDDEMRIPSVLILNFKDKLVNNH